MKKICKKCHIEKDIKQFYKKTSNKDGRRSECIKCSKSNNSAYYIKKQDKIKERQKTYYENNIEWAQEYNKRYKQQNKESLKEKQREYRRTSIRKRARNIWEKDKKKNDQGYKIACSLRTRISKFIKNNKIGSAVDDLGCTIEFLKLYIEKKFYGDMSWGNYGEWHIDHILPLSSFDLTNREQFVRACHYTNLQPLWWWENLSKGAKLNEK
jgi:hypothetical protein